MFREMNIAEQAANFARRAFFFAALQLLAITAQAKPAVTFTSPCECIGNHGVSRWSAKIDMQEPPTNSAEIKPITPAQIKSWQGPGGKIDQRSKRIAAENQWYAVTGRVEKVKVEDDGDVHIDLKDVGGDAGMVVELPLGPRWCELRKMVFSWTNATFPLTGKFKLVQHPIVTVTGKALYDIDHSGKDTQTNRRNYDESLAVWEIHPVMKIVIGAANSGSVPVAPTPLTIFSPATTPIPQATGAFEQFVTLTKTITIQVPYGTTLLQAGTRLPVLSRDSQTVDVRYMDARYTIPVSSTDLH